MFDDVEEMERNAGRACGKADKRSIDLARIRPFTFSTEESEDTEDTEALSRCRVDAETGSPLRS